MRHISAIAIAVLFLLPTHPNAVGDDGMNTVTISRPTDALIPFNPAQVINPIDQKPLSSGLIATTRLPTNWWLLSASTKSV